MSIDPTQMNADDFMHGIESELKRCLDLLLRIEDEVLPIVAHSMVPSLRSALQDIDLLSQCIDDIARCVHAIGLQPNMAVSVDARAILSKIRLQDMRIRIGGGDYDTRKLSLREEIFTPPKAATDPDNHLF